MKTVYQCDHCDFVNELEGVVSFHESHCISNPVNDSCGTCKFETEVFDEIHGWEPSCNAGIYGDVLVNILNEHQVCLQYKAKKNV